MKARHNIRVRGRIDEIPQNNIGPIFIGMVAVITGIMLVAILFGGMGPATADVQLKPACAIEDAGSNVLYFHCMGAEFETAVEKLRPYMDVRAIFPDEESGDGTTVFVDRH